MRRGRFAPRNSRGGMNARYFPIRTVTGYVGESGRTNLVGGSPGEPHERPMRLVAGHEHHATRSIALCLHQHCHEMPQEPAYSRDWNNRATVMSTSVEKRTHAVQRRMSALPRIATAKADSRNGHVRFTPKSRHAQCNGSCLLWAKSGHRRLCRPPRLRSRLPRKGLPVRAFGKWHRQSPRDAGRPEEPV